MGLAASQARLLFLTSRMSDLELRAEVISGAKIRLAQQSSAASLEYTKELDKKKLQVQNGYSNGSPTYIPATAENVTAYNPNGPQRIIENAAGQVLVSQAIKDAYDASGGDLKTFLKTMLGDKGEDAYSKGVNAESQLSDLINSGELTLGNINSTDPSKNIQTLLRQIQDGLNSQANNTSLSSGTRQNITDLNTAINDAIQGFTGRFNNPGHVPTQADLDFEIINIQKLLRQNNGIQNTMSAATKEMGSTAVDGQTQYYTILFNQIKSSGGCFTVSEENYKSTGWLENGVRNNSLFLYEPKKQPDSSIKIESVSWTSGDNTIQEVDDSTETAKAEAKYEATVSEIQAKDKRYDLQLKQVDTEHSATQNEIDSVKKIIDKNIDRAFKIFQA